jgi:hypothetical protein
VAKIEGFFMYMKYSTKRDFVYFFYVCVFGQVYPPGYARVENGRKLSKIEGFSLLYQLLYAKKWVFFVYFFYVYLKSPCLTHFKMWYTPGGMCGAGCKL